MVLTRVLEASGLREGMNMKLRSASKMTPARGCSGCHRAVAAGKRCGDRRQNDAVAYERYFNAEDDYTRESALRNISRRCVTISVCWDAKIINAAGAANPGLRADVYSR